MDSPKEGDHSVKNRSTVWRPGEPEDYSGDMSYLEELEKHRLSVWWVTYSTFLSFDLKSLTPTNLFALFYLFSGQNCLCVHCRL